MLRFIKKAFNGVLLIIVGLIGIFPFQTFLQSVLICKNLRKMAKLLSLKDIFRWNLVNCHLQLIESLVKRFEIKISSLIMITLAFPLWMQDKMPIIITCHWNLSPHID